MGSLAMLAFTCWRTLLVAATLATDICAAENEVASAATVKAPATKRENLGDFINVCLLIPQTTCCGVIIVMGEQFEQHQRMNLVLIGIVVSHRKWVWVKTKTTRRNKKHTFVQNIAHLQMSRPIRLSASIGDIWPTLSPGFAGLYDARNGL